MVELLSLWAYALVGIGAWPAFWISMVAIIKPRGIGERTLTGLLAFFAGVLWPVSVTFVLLRRIT